jgi:hypothetical protein
MGARLNFSEHDEKVGRPSGWRAPYWSALLRVRGRKSRWRYNDCQSRLFLVRVRSGRNRRRETRKRPGGKVVLFRLLSRGGGREQGGNDIALSP